MATTPRTLTELQQIIHSTLEGDTTIPDTGDDDYLLRTALINRFIGDWENEEGTDWRVLWSTYSGLLLQGQRNYTLPSNFVKAGGYLRLNQTNGNETLIPIIKQSQVQLERGASKQIAYITGDLSNGFTLYLGFDPTAEQAGLTIELDYYKQATALSTGIDETEVPNTLYLVDSVVAEIHSQQNSLSRYTLHSTRAQSHLASMIEQNDSTPEYQDEVLEDNGFSFGN